MAQNKTKVFFKDMLKTALYVLFGLFVFVLSTLLLNRRNYADRAIRFWSISERDGCRLDYPDELKISKEGSILLYVETKPCANCSESIIMNIVNSLKKAELRVEPVMLFHPVSVVDSSRIDDYYGKYAEHINLVVSCEDSIMIKNPWMQEGFGFYGIVTDSTDMVKFAGSFLDPGFLACCNKEFGKMNILNGAEP